MGNSIRLTPLKGVLIGVAMALVLVAWWSQRRAVASTEPIGLFTSLPLMWSNAADLADELRADLPEHWAKRLLAQRGRIVALDVLTAAPGPQSLAGFRRLIIAQPRALSPQENVALDNWVRGGGRLLLLADPDYSEESPFALGDPRRPQTAAMLSPILSRWGLALQFDPAQPPDPEVRDVLGTEIPVLSPGRLETRGQANCKLWAAGLAATCAIGRGRVVALADAALLEADDPGARGARALAGMLDNAFLVR